MARRDFRRGAAAIRSRRETSWLNIPAASATMAAVGGTIMASLTVPEKARRPFTIVRTYLEVMVSTDQLGADEFQIAAVGLAVVSDQAEAIGITAIPTPASDADSDLWFLHQWVMADFAFLDATGTQNVGNHYSIDSKAMRKVNDSQDVVVVAEFDAASFGLTVRLAGRILIKDS